MQIPPPTASLAHTPQNIAVDEHYEVIQEFIDADEDELFFEACKSPQVITVVTLVEGGRTARDRCLLRHVHHYMEANEKRRRSGEICARTLVSYSASDNSRAPNLKWILGWRLGSW